jgi:hypothetical protein
MPLVSARGFAFLLVWFLLASFSCTPLIAAESLSPAGNSELIPLLPVGSTNSGHAFSILPYLPSAAQNTGAGVLIVPNAPLPGSNPDREAAPLAQWLNAHGIAAFILYYADDGSLNAGADVPQVTRALRYLHAHATDFHLSASRIGVLGLGDGGSIAAPAAFANPPPFNLDSPDPIDLASAHPDFLALIDGASLPAAPAAFPPPTFLVGSTNAQDNLSVMIDLWNYLRSPRLRVPVEAHFFPKMEINDGIAQGDPTLGVWPNLFYNWVRAYGFLTDLPRVAIHGSVSLDGRPLPFGYVILTPLDTVGAGPIIARVFNSTAGVTIGSFSVPANQGPAPGRYRVDVRQNANRWLSNAFSADLIRDPAFGHSRILSPSIDDQHSYTKAHPGDKDDIVVDIKPGDNPDLNIAVFSQ